MNAGNAKFKSSCSSNAAKFYKALPLNPHFGIEAHDIDLSDPCLLHSDEFISQLKQDLVRYRAILFRSQSLTGQQQVDISASLGTIESTFYKHPKSPHPDIFRVSNDEAEGCTQVGRSGWHIDGTFQTRPFMYQTMYFPSAAEGGDTLFIPLKELYDSFSDEDKTYYNTLWMVTGRGREILLHPLVCKHPFRNEETLLFHCGRPFVWGWCCDHGDINSCKNENNGESYVLNGVDIHKMIDASIIQDQLTQKIESKFHELGIRMKWQRGDFLITDNLGLAHYASEGTQRYRGDVGLRILHRTTIVGNDETVPSKFDGRKSFTA
ncbi:hypothetical protein HJC23_011206 [Cyclotella cryptica]|uniref:TauD/TfdA-like domain-containing protein n=1 Tax=Cyclotella cryptica TaxID=29204 RepID=A0ABD3PWE2_9STRA|eukprot:CCRYP_011009-RA/>CCRYP_011009-RA protein AED:0.13 eAED:0.13 QI:0/-1/0/1/-1/1/1/0/321